MAERLMQALLSTAGTSFPRVFEIGCGTGLLTRQAFTRLTMEHYIANDLVPACGERVQRNISPTIEFIPGAVECLPQLPEVDLVLSNATLHWIRPLAELLQRLADAVKPGGWLAITTFGPDNFKELNLLLELPLAYPTHEAWQVWLKPNWEIVQAEVWRDTLYFFTPLDVFRHFRATGVNSLTAPRLSKTQWQKLLEQYGRETVEAQGIPLTYHPMLWLARRIA
jgi:malonyl-CoA O-methyltransferase